MRIRLAVGGLGLLLLLGCGGGGNPLVPQLRPVTGGFISSEFGARPVHPLKGYVPGGHHDGYDIAVAQGSPIQASMTGTVSFVGWRGGYGNTVILTHDGGYATLYGHASELLVQDGQRVAQGELIAKVGSTGLSTGPHLHYELRKNGVAMDPGGFLDEPNPVVAASFERPLAPQVALKQDPTPPPAPPAAIERSVPVPAQLPAHAWAAFEIEASAASPGRCWD